MLPLVPLSTTGSVTAGTLTSRFHGAYVWPTRLLHLYQLLSQKHLWHPLLQEPLPRLQFRALKPTRQPCARSSLDEGTLVQGEEYQ